MENGVRVRQLFLVNLPRAEVFAFWRRLEDFPKFMQNVHTVQELDDKRSQWVVEGVGGKRVTWDAEIVEEDPGRVLAWRTVGHPDVRHGGRVEFFEATGGRGTVVAVQMSYESPVGNAAPILLKLFGKDPEERIREDLRRFKQLAETGEIPTIEGQPSGKDAEREAEETAPAKPRRPRRRARSEVERGEVAP
jgi:uncharacterized membrane protein